MAGYQPHLSYNIALCHYRLKQYAPALKHIGKVILAFNIIDTNYTLIIEFHIAQINCITQHSFLSGMNVTKPQNWTIYLMNYLPPHGCLESVE